MARSIYVEQPGALRLSDGLFISRNEQFWWDDYDKKWVEIAEGSGIYRQIQRELHGAPASAVVEEPGRPGFWKNLGHAIQAQAERDRVDRARKAEVKATMVSAAPSRRPELKVKSYRDEKEFEHDAKKMLKDGWELKGQSSKIQKTSVMRTLGERALIGQWGTLLLGSAKKGDTITATWVR